MDFVRKGKYNINDLIEIVRILREPDGCPWDREQTHQSIRKNLIEETYEVADAIDLNDSDLLCEELGDLLLQIALHTRMEQEAGRFNFDDVCDGICKKLIHRHPHVFGNLGDLETRQVLENWEKLKNQEKGRNSLADRLDSVPNSLPGLMRSGKVQKRAADYGFSYENTIHALIDLESEVKELRSALEAGNSGEIEHELGDVLFSAVNVSRMAGHDAEEALSKTTDRFVNRVKCADGLAQGKDLTALSAQQLDSLWKEAKQCVQQASEEHK